MLQRREMGETREREGREGERGGRERERERERERREREYTEVIASHIHKHGSELTRSAASKAFLYRNFLRYLS